MIDPSKYKAYAGAGSAGVGILASLPVAEAITDLVVWGISFLGTVPPDVETAINTLAMAIVTAIITGVATYFAPPNQAKGETVGNS